MTKPAHRLALLDTSCLISPPPDLPVIAAAAAISTLSVAELAFGLHTPDPMQAAQREARYRTVLRTFDPVPFSASAAHWYGAVAATVRLAGRDPRPRRIDLMLAAVAAELGAVLVTRNADDFRGLDDIITVVAV